MSFTPVTPGSLPRNPTGAAGPLARLPIEDRRAASPGIVGSIAMVRLLFDESPVPTMALDPAWRIVAVNHALCEATGYRRAQLIGVDPLSLHVPEDKPELSALRAEETQRAGLLAAGGLRRGEYSGRRLLCANGATLAHRLVFRELPGPDGRVYQLCSLLDTGMESAARQLIEHRSRRVEGFFDFSPVAMVMRDADFRITEVNQALLRLTGFAAHELVGRPIFFQSAEESTTAGTLRGRFESMHRDTGLTDDVRLPIRTRDGRLLWIRHQTSRLDGGAAGGFISVLTEFDPGSSTGTTAPTAVALSQHAGDQPSTPTLTSGTVDPLARRFADAAPDMVLLLQPDDSLDGHLPRIDYCNQQVFRLMGVERDAVLTTSDALLERVAAEDRDRLSTAWRRFQQAIRVAGRAGEQTRREPVDTPASSGGASVGVDAALAADDSGDLSDRTVADELELQVRHPARGLRTVRLRLIGSPGGDGRSTIIGEDVTRARRRERERLEAAHQQRDVLVREVHHRIKNNLQGVAGLLQQMADRRPEMAGPLDDIAGQVQAIAQVHGLHVENHQALLPTQMIEAVFMNLARNFGVPIGIDASGAGPAATVDPWVLPEQEAVPIALIINELGTNAIKHRGANGRVGVRWQHTDHDMLIAISNDGQLPAGFDFTRLQSGASGLGLVKSMLPRRGAELRFEQAGDRVVASLRLKPPALSPMATSAPARSP